MRKQSYSCIRSLEASSESHRIELATETEMLSPFEVVVQRQFQGMLPWEASAVLFHSNVLILCVYNRPQPLEMSVQHILKS